MNDETDIEKKDMSKSNILFAVILGLVALTVGIMPFFYLNSANL